MGFNFQDPQKYSYDVENSRFEVYNLEDVLNWKPAQINSGKSPI